MFKKKEKKTMLSAFSIILIITLLLGIVSNLLPQARFVSGEIVNGSGVVGAQLSSVLMSPILGLQQVVDECVFLIIFGALLAVVRKTGALYEGIKLLIKKLKGRELLLISILMFIFSICGTIYGIHEGAIVFYALLAFLFVSAGMDTLVSFATVLFGFGVGALGFTVNPFSVSAIIDSLPYDIAVDQGIIITIGVVLWISAYIIALLCVIGYAKKVMKKKGSTFLSLQEQSAVEERYGKKENVGNAVLATRQKVTLWIFGISILVMVLGFIPWDSFAGFLTFEYWSFNDCALWFFVITILLCIINKFSEKEAVETFISGAVDMISAILIIGLARGLSIIISSTYLDNYIIYNVVEILDGLPMLLYVPFSFVLYIFLSILVPSSSDFAMLSLPIMGNLTSQLGTSVEVNVMIIVAANGLANLITPVCGLIMGGLAISRIEYLTWFKWVWKKVLYIGIASLIILTLGMLVF